jgi:hypothetical protein
MEGKTRVCAPSFVIILTLSLIVFRMFITNHHVAFSGWPELKILISLKDIVDIEKKQLFFVNNALTIHDCNGEEYFFGSFLDRDLCFRMLSSLVQIEKSLVELTEESSPGSAKDSTIGEAGGSTLQ